MQKSANVEKMGPPIEERSATRFGVNHNWCFRGDNTKPKEKK